MKSYYSPGHWYRNYYGNFKMPSGGHVSRTPPVGYKLSKYQQSWTDPATRATYTTPGLTRVGGKSGFGNSLLSPPKLQPPSISSSIDLNSMMQDYKPESVGRQWDAAQASRAIADADPAFLAEQLAADQSNQASVLSGQSMDLMRRSMAPLLAQASMVRASGPVDRAIDRYQFGTRGLGSQASEVMQHAGNQIGMQQDALQDWYNQFQDRNRMIRLMLG